MMFSKRVLIGVCASIALLACADPTSSFTSPEAMRADADNAGTASWAPVLIPPLPDSLGIGFTATSQAYAVNNRGTVVGHSSRSFAPTCSGRAAFMRRNGVMIDLLRALGSSYSCAAGFSYAMDVNDQDVAVGSVSSAFNSVVPWMWTPQGGPVILTSNGVDRFANGINNHGVVVGHVTSQLTGNHAVMWTSPTVMVDIHPAGYNSSMAWDIDDNGVIVGIADQHIVKWLADGTFIDSGRRIAKSFGGAFFGSDLIPLAINNVSLVSGSYTSSSFSTGFAWLPDLSWVNRGAPPENILDLSDRGRTVGWSTNTQGFDQAVTRRPTFGPTWLNPPNGYTSSWATGVNRCGDVVGVAEQNGVKRAVAWRNSQCDQ